MKRVLYTQRVEIKEGYGERWDCADQKIPEFIRCCGYLPVPIPNIPELADEIIGELNPTGIVLTGGNSLVKYGGNAPERDDMDRRVIEIAIDKNIPLYGFCRGMQSVLEYFGSEIMPVDNHIALRHNICGEIEANVNSYHSLGAKEINAPLRILAKSADGVIEAAECCEYKIVVTMWHPEREKPFCKDDMERLKTLFG